MIRSRSITLLVPLALLAACNKSAPENDKRSASGEVLEGTTSDAMIPLGQLQSKPPLLEPSKAPTTPEAVEDRAEEGEGGERPAEAPDVGDAPSPASSAAP